MTEIKLPPHASVKPALYTYDLNAVFNAVAAEQEGVTAFRSIDNGAHVYHSADHLAMHKAFGRDHTLKRAVTILEDWQNAGVQQISTEVPFRQPEDAVSPDTGDMVDQIVRGTCKPVL